MKYNLLLEKEDVVNDFMIANQRRFKAEGNHSVFIRDFKQSITEINDRYLVNVSLEIGIPPIYLVGIFISIVGLIFQSFFWIYFGLIFFLISIFWTPEFQRLVFKKGLRKAGYKGIIENIKNDEALGMIIYESDGIIKLV
jgi:hypothetical protein